MFAKTKKKESKIFVIHNINRLHINIINKQQQTNAYEFKKLIL